mgnify:CR=1 FL=1
MSENEKKFITIGSTRLKLSNIKQYGIGRRPWVSTHPLVQIYALIKKKEGKQYIYITTYQGDNYTFTEDEIDVPKVFKELDSYLAN